MEGLAFADGKLYISGGELVAVDARTGARAFSTHLSSPTIHGAMQTPIVSHGIVYTAVGGLGVHGYIPRHYAIDGTTGRILWSVGRLGTTTPAIAAGRVFVGYDDQQCDAPSCARGHSVVYDARTGRVLWLLPQSAAFQGQWIVATGRVVQGVQGAGSNTTETPGPVHTHAFTPAGVPLWTTSGFLPAAAAYGHVYGISEGHVAALDATNGQPAWRSDVSDKDLIGTTALVVANGTVFVAETHDIVALNAMNGQRLATVPLPPNLLGRGKLEVADGMLFEVAQGCCTTQGAITGDYLIAFG